MAHCDNTMDQKLIAVAKLLLNAMVSREVERDGCLTKQARAFPQFGATHSRDKDVNSFS